MGRPMDLNFQLFETATLIITVLVVAFMLQVCEQRKFYSRIRKTKTYCRENNFTYLLWCELCRKELLITSKD